MKRVGKSGKSAWYCTCIMLHMCIKIMLGQLVDCEVMVHVSAGWRFLSLNEESQWTFALAIKAIISP